MTFRWMIAAAAALMLLACAPDRTAIAAAAMDEGRTFLTTNAKAPGVITLASGLQYKIIKSGPADGLKPRRGDEVKVNYEGKLISGKVFDSSYQRGIPSALPLDALVPGWIEALQLMRPGDEWILYVPSNLAYGENGAGEIPPGSTLIFRIELLDVLPGPGHPSQG
ncbi:MAG: peptidylprolyl isomerase [Phenylobacterium zucineum]|nr:MAG: peptidylprolyl isomerase [Phenylobacterium zucineum]